MYSCMDAVREAKIGAIRSYVQSVFRESGSHGYDHILRVTRLCELLGAREDANMDILLPAALFHDIARPLEEETGLPHEVEGARIAESFLRKVDYDEALIHGVTHAIGTHRYRSDKKPETLEAMILSDADKLDAMGATGIARTFMQAGENDGDMQDAASHIHEKLLKLKGRMYTKSARELAGRRHEVLEMFVQALDDEVDGTLSSPDE
jgi:uncharacterized protein